MVCPSLSRNQLTEFSLPNYDSSMQNSSSSKQNNPKPRSRSGLNSGIDVLDCLVAHSQPLSLTEIAAALGMAKSSVLQLLTTLQQRGLVRRQADQRYVIGLRAWEIGCHAGPVELGRLAQPHMSQLARDICEGIALAMFETDHTVCIQLADAPDNPVRVHANIGDRTPAHCGSSGLALLAQMHDAEVERLFEDKLPRMTPTTLGTRSALLKELAQVRQRGYALSLGAWREDVGGVAIALAGPEGRAVAALNVAAPVRKFTRDWLEQAIPAIRQTAREIERAFGAPMEPVAALAPSMQATRATRRAA